MMPTPPCCAMPMAMCDSVTVSMAALKIGILRRLSRVTCVFALVAVAARLQAQSSSQGVSAATIRVSKRLVLVDVVVTDKQGKPVSGLKAEDFTIEEKGKKQKIGVFQTPEEAQQQNTPPQLG